MAGLITPPNIARAYRMAGITASAAQRIARSPEAKFIAKALQGAYRKRKRAKVNVANRSGIGVTTPVVDAQKHTQAAGNPFDHSTRQMYFHDLTNVEKATGDNEIDRRQRQVIHISGFTIDFMMRNNRPVHLLLNVAIVSPRNNNNVTPLVSGFFREYTESRDVDFSIGLNCNQFHTYPISTDRWRVLMHRRYKIGPQINYNSATGNNGIGNMVARKLWCPLNRAITYNDDTVIESEAKVFLIYWCDEMGAPGGSDKIPQGAFGSFRTVTYFKEIAGARSGLYRVG